MAAGADKKVLYKTAGVPIDATLKSAGTWSPEEIDARTKALAKLGYEKVFLV